MLTNMLTDCWDLTHIGWLPSSRVFVYHQRVRCGDMMRKTSLAKNASIRYVMHAYSATKTKTRSVQVVSLTGNFFHRGPRGIILVIAYSFHFQASGEAVHPDEWMLRTEVRRPFKWHMMQLSCETRRSIGVHDPLILLQELRGRYSQQPLILLAHWPS